MENAQDVTTQLQHVKTAIVVLELTACHVTSAQMNVNQRAQDINVTGMRPIQNVSKMTKEL